MIKQNKLDEAKQIINKIYNFTGDESRKEYLLKHISDIEKENNRIKEIKDNSGNTIIKYNDEINLYEFIKKINNNTVYLSNNEIIKNDNLLNYLNNFNKDFELFTKMISSNKYKEICKELLESYFSDLKDIISEDKIKKFGNIKSNISKCKLNNELFYNPIDRLIRFNVIISLIDYTGDATCEMSIKENDYIVKIIDIYCD